MCVLSGVQEATPLPNLSSSFAAACKNREKNDHRFWGLALHTYVMAHLNFM